MMMMMVMIHIYLLTIHIFTIIGYVTKSSRLYSYSDKNWNLSLSTL